jgi:RNA polymerase sigma-70 factor (ECF subfamily)
LSSTDDRNLPLEDRLKSRFLAGGSGDAKAYGEFLELAAKIIRSNLRKTIPSSQSHSRDLLEDLVQDVLLALHQKRHTFRAEYPLLPWLFAIARHRWIDIARMLSVRPDLLNWEESDFSMLPDADAVERVERTEAEMDAKEKVTDMLEALSPKQRELIRMAKLEELPLAEVAVRLGMSLSAVKVGVHRAMHKLAETGGQKK